LSIGDYGNGDDGNDVDDDDDDGDDIHYSVIVPPTPMYAHERMRRGTYERNY
jgi:hypothetical protein